VDFVDYFSSIICSGDWVVAAKNLEVPALTSEQDKD